MKKRLTIVPFLLLSLTVLAQALEPSPNNIYSNQDQGVQQPLPYPHVRQSDIVWSTDLWKSVNVEELFNQFFYFPDDDLHTHGKKSLAYIIWDAMASGEIPIYEDDMLHIPIDNELFVRRYTKPDTILLEIGYDEDDNEMYQTVIRPKFFDGSEIHNYAFREVWFIGRQDTRLDSRRLALAPVKDTYRSVLQGEDIYLGRLPMFWIPMQHPAVRALLARYTAYVVDDNLARLPSWDWVFVNQYYEAYTTRMSNIHNRSISSYVTGEDAILEAERIENMVFDLGSDMWEY